MHFHQVVQADDGGMGYLVTNTHFWCDTSKCT